MLTRPSALSVLTAVAITTACGTHDPSGDTAAPGRVNLVDHLDVAELSPVLERALYLVSQNHALRAPSGEWRVEQDIAYESTVSVDESALFRAVRLTPLPDTSSVWVDIRIEPGSQALGSGGLLFRMRDEHNGYGVLLTEGVGVSLLKIQDGRPEFLVTQKIDVAEGRWYRLRVSMTESGIRSWLDDRQVLAVDDPEVAPTGGIGIFRSRGEQTAFRNLVTGEGGEANGIELDFPAPVPLLQPLLELRARGENDSQTKPRDLLVQRVALSEDYRSALIIPPDTEVGLPLTLPASGLLQYELGVLSNSLELERGSSRISIIFEAGLDSRALRRHLLSAIADSRTWDPVRIDLSEFAGTAGRLVFRNESIGDVTGAYAALATPTLVSGRTQGQPNLVLITIDTLRADHLGLYGYARDTSPFLDELGAASVVFSDVVAQSSWTKTSMASLLTSTYPEANSVRGVTDRLSGRFDSIAEVLRENGYFTAGVQTNPWVHPRFGLAQGFAEFYAVTGLASASQVNERAVQILRRRGNEPFFLYLHYMDVHHPYAPPEAYKLFGERDEDRYDGEIRYLDSQLKALHASLREEGWLQNTLFVVTSDHGEEFGEHGGAYHGGTLFREQVHVPWILSWPGRLNDGKRIDGVVQNIDIVPSLLELLGVPVPTSFQGHSLQDRITHSGMEADKPRVAYAQVGLNDVAPERDLLAVVDGRWKFIADRHGEWRVLFDRVADPRETRNLLKIEPDVIERLEQQAARFLSLYKGDPSTAEPSEIDPELRDRLRSLGYLN